MPDEPTRDDDARADALRAVSGFLLDAARGEVSTRTVIQVLRHWMSEGVTEPQLLEATGIALRTAESKHLETLHAYETAIHAGLRLEDEI